MHLARKNRSADQWIKDFWHRQIGDLLQHVAGGGMTFNLNPVTSQLLHHAPACGMAHAQLLRHLGAAHYHCGVIAQHPDKPVQARISRALPTPRLTPDFLLRGYPSIISNSLGALTVFVV